MGNTQAKLTEILAAVSPTFAGQKFPIAPPSISIQESMQHRLAFFNRYNLYKRNCSATGKPIVSIYSPDKSLIVYERAYWESDNWEASAYGQDFDFSKTFAENWDNLNIKVPHIALWSGDNENSDFSHDAAFNKDCYLLFDSIYCEEGLYINSSNNLTSCVDVSFCDESEMLYECLHTQGYKSFYCSFCGDISECYFCYDCSNSKNCFGCVNVENGQYQWFNQQLSEEEYKNRLSNTLANPNFLKQAAKQLQELIASLPRRASQIKFSENCTGDYIYNSNSCQECFDISEGEHLLGCHDMFKADNAAYSGNLCTGVSYAYECQNVANGSSNSAFCIGCADGISNSYYSSECLTGEHLFGCIGLKHKKYSILNKSYTAHEYEKMAAKIAAHMQETGEWGKFLPAYVSSFGYNESAANMLFPLSEYEATNKGFNWSDYVQEKPQVSKIIHKEHYKTLPPISKITDEVLDWALECEVTGKLFQIMPMELTFYREHNLPLPTKHPQQRLNDRLNMKNPHQIFPRNCGNCNKPLKTTFPPQNPAKIFCSECFLNYVNN